MDKVQFEKAMQIYSQRFSNAGDFTFFFVGAIDIEKTIPLLETYIGGLTSQPKRENFIDRGIRPPVGPLDKMVKKGSEPQSQVNIVFTGDTKYDAREAYALSSLGDVLSITLIEQLREQIGGVYGIGASGSMGKLPRPTYTFYIGFPCAPENVEKLTKAALAEVQKIQLHGVTKEDLEKVKEQQKRKLEVEIKQNQFWINSLYDAYVSSNDPNDILKKQELIDKLDSKMIQAAANKYLNLKKYLRVYLVPEKAEEKKAF
jgi:zinc protease